MADAKEYEEAKATQKLSIPEFSDVEIRVRAENGIDNYMQWARNTNGVGYARYYETRAQAVAKNHDIPIPKLSDVELRVVARKEKDHIMKIAREDADTVFCARLWERDAQAVAKEFDIPLPKLSDADIRQIEKREMSPYRGNYLQNNMCRIL